ncbi:HAEPLYID family protein [Fibrella aquatica]|uniref:HAEPLYID family protein n=1 Tax=Fibrella aquatica TaxID=3242487 RepID=UPI00351F825F
MLFTNNRLIAPFALWAVLLVFFSLSASGQVTQDEERQQARERLDSLYINEVEDQQKPVKVLHAEPLYIDLIRDLGARKGEKEWNVGLGLTDNLRYDAYQALVEYEWAPADRIGLEVELPFSFYTRNEPNGTRPVNQLDGIKTAIQWSFFVSERLQTSLAVGYINELELRNFDELRGGSWLKGNTFNPFLIAAKRWGTNFHTLVYAGPQIERSFYSPGWKTVMQINSSLHYMIPGSRNFLGIEANKEIVDQKMSMVMRPQLRVSVADNLLVGIVTGIPIDKQNQRLSSFLRLIYEPGHRNNSSVTPIRPGRIMGDRAITH